MIISATGHRPNKLGGYDTKISNILFDVAEDWITGTDLSITKIISGMALGWDQTVAWAAYNLNIPFIAAVPFEGQERMWPSQSQRNYQYLLKVAYEVIIVTEGQYAPWKMQVRNEWMVDRCDAMLAL